MKNARAGWDSHSAFPPGLEATRSAFPAMNCWAILTHPSGMFPGSNEVFVRVARLIAPRVY